MGRSASGLTTQREHTNRVGRAQPRTAWPPGADLSSACPHECEAGGEEASFSAGCWRPREIPQTNALAVEAVGHDTGTGAKRQI